MNVFITRIFSLAAIGFLSGSVFSLLFPGSTVFPTFVFAFAIALSLSRGFLEAFPAVVAIGLFADAATLGRVGVLSGFGVGLAYTASFFSRRFAVEHSALTTVFSGLLAGIATVFFSVFSGLLLYGSIGADQVFQALFSWHPIVSIVSGIIFSAFAIVSIRKYDELISRMDPGATFFVRRQKR